MSVVDKAIAAITPPESESARAEATAKAEAAAQPGDWLSLVLEHHRLLRAAMKGAIDAPLSERAAKMKDMAIILAGHAQAEEIVLYPALAKAKEKGHADMGYTEQVAVKMQMAELERLDPASQDWVTSWSTFKAPSSTTCSKKKALGFSNSTTGRRSEQDHATLRGRVRSLRVVRFKVERRR